MYEILPVKRPGTFNSTRVEELYIHYRHYVVTKYTDTWDFLKGCDFVPTR